MSDFSAIRSSYVQAAYSKAAETKPKPADANPATADFSTMVSNAAAQAVETVRTGDQMAIAGLNGQAQSRTVLRHLLKKCNLAAKKMRTPRQIRDQRMFLGAVFAR